MNNKISIILPAYNEEAAIAAVLEDVITVMRENKYNFEIIVVDDGSTDRTAEIAEKRSVRIIKHMINRGCGEAVKTGILNAQGDTIVMLDADGTYPASSIPELLRHIPQYDQIIGARKKEQGTFRILRQPIKRLIFKLASYLAEEEIPDLNSGFRAFKKDIITEYLHLIPNGFSYVSTITLIFICNGYSVKFIPIEYNKRIGKSKFKMLAGTKGILFTIVRIIMYFKPLRIFIPFSLLLFIFGTVKTICDIYFCSTKSMQESDVVILVISANILILGLLADLIVTQGKKGC